MAASQTTVDIYIFKIRELFIIDYYDVRLKNIQWYSIWLIIVECKPNQQCYNDMMIIKIDKLF